MSIKNHIILNVVFFSLNLICTYTRLNPSNVEIAINCGGPEFRTKSGVTYQKDKYFIGGEASDFGINSEIKNTKDKEIYQTERWSTEDLIYDIPLKKEGKYVLVLKFSEVYFNSKGEKLPYELSEIDSEIIRLTGRKKPRVLFLAHAQISFGFENELRYYETIKKIYGDMFGCDFRWLKASELTDNFEKAQNDVSWADIIYEGGGNTVTMVELWKKTGFDNLLRDAWKTGKVMCGVSAGAICWFALGNTDVPGYKEAEVNQIPGLGFIDAYFSPHCNKEGKRESEINSLKHIDKVVRFNTPIRNFKLNEDFLNTC